MTPARAQGRAEEKKEPRFVKTTAKAGLAVVGALIAVLALIYVMGGMKQEKSSKSE